MPMWYETIQDDKQLNTLLSNEMRRSSSEYNKLNHHFLRPMLDEIGYLQRVDPYSGTQAYGYNYSPPPSYYDARNMNDKELDMVIKNVGEALFMTLVELNPTYAKRLLNHGLRCTMDEEFLKLEKRDNQRRNRVPTPSASVVDHAQTYQEYITPSRRPALVTDDYEYWWDYSECGSVIYVMSDYDGTPKTGLIDIAFDPDDPEEVDAAVQKAEDAVRKLCSNQLDINNLVSRSDDPQSRSDKTATEMRVKMEPMATMVEEAAAQFETMVSTTMLENAIKKAGKFGILSGNIT